MILPQNRRKSAKDPLALCGYWCSPVQKVVKKWIPVIGEDFCKHYIMSCWFSVRAGTDGISISLITEGHIGYALEVMLAMNSVVRATKKSDIWLLEMFNSGRYEDGKPQLPTYENLSKRIKDNCGVFFTPESLMQKSLRLKLV